MMSSSRMEAFTDGVLAIIITIMVLELEAPDSGSWHALLRAVPGLLVYIVSFGFIGAHWLNHHHLLQLTEKVDGKVLWSNMLWLMIISLLPVSLAWLERTQFAQIPTVFYAVLSLLTTLAYFLLEYTILHTEYCRDRCDYLIGSRRKEWISLILEILALVFAIVLPTRVPAYVCLFLVTMLWILPDLRIVNALKVLESPDEPEPGKGSADGTDE